MTAFRSPAAMIRFGLCCLFIKEPVRFRTVTASALLRLSDGERLTRASEICLENAKNLLLALRACNRLGIGAFRVTSPLFPRMTHPEAGYRMEDLPAREEILRTLKAVRTYARRHDIRLSFHPDQFVVLSSPDPAVVLNSLREIRYQAYLAKMIGADTLNLHGGGAYGHKPGALARLAGEIRRFPSAIRRMITLENDDRTYTPKDLHPVCRKLGIPLVYDVHHHRCNPDGWSEEEASRASLETWAAVGREPWFHISSPKGGWRSGDPRSHADFIDPKDFPRTWLDLDLTVDVEAKAKELAVVRLMESLKPRVRASR